MCIYYDYLYFVIAMYHYYVSMIYDNIIYRITYREHGDSSSLRRKGLRKLEELPSHGLMHSDADI